MAGAEKIYSVDIAFLTDKEKIITTIKRIVDCENSGKLKKYVQPIPEKFSVLTTILSDENNITLSEILFRLNLIYLIQDARKLDLPDKSIDLINSNNTFEHIYPELLIGMLREFSRIVKPGGVMSHFIDMSDHFAHLDKTITIYNFLKFSDAEWKWIDNSIQPMNRMRITDYRKIYTDLGIAVTHEISRPGSVDDLKKIKPDAKFLANSDQENAISHSYFITKAAG